MLFTALALLSAVLFTLSLLLPSELDGLPSSGGAPWESCGLQQRAQQDCCNPGCLSTLPLGSVACAASSLLSAAGAAFTAIAIEELRPVLAAEARGEGT